jgi:hypothetical protein
MLTIVENKAWLLYEKQLVYAYVQDIKNENIAVNIVL